MKHKLQLTNQEFIRRAKETHGDKYFYGITKYTGAFKKVNIFCRKHGKLFSLIAGDHTQGRGCPLCTKEKEKPNEVQRVSIQEFITRACIKHGGKYDYSLVQFKYTKDKISIVCKEHGVFTQEVTKHLLGCGCRSCANGRNKNGWSYNLWEKQGNQSPGFEAFRLYVIKLVGTDGEEFYKVGKTFRAVSSRIVKGAILYKFTIVKVVEGTAKEISVLERRMHKSNKQWKYVPTKRFDGCNECFSYVDLKDINEN